MQCSDRGLGNPRGAATHRQRFRNAATHPAGAAAQIGGILLMVGRSAGAKVSLCRNPRRSPAHVADGRVSNGVSAFSIA